MKDTVWMILAALWIGLLLWAVAIAGAFLEAQPGTLEGVAIPQNRPDWPNPAGYGLPPETEEYNGIFY